MPPVAGGTLTSTGCALAWPACGRAGGRRRPTDCQTVRCMESSAQVDAMLRARYVPRGACTYHRRRHGSDRSGSSRGMVNRGPKGGRSRSSSGPVLQGSRGRRSHPGPFSFDEVGQVAAPLYFALGGACGVRACSKAITGAWFGGFTIQAPSCGMAAVQSADVFCGCRDQPRAAAMRPGSSGRSSKHTSRPRRARAPRCWPATSCGRCCAGATTGPRAGRPSDNHAAGWPR